MRSRITAVGLAGLLCGLLLWPAPVAGHSFLQETRPAAGAALDRGPKRVALLFNEPVEAEFAVIAVATRKGRRFSTAPVVQPADDRLVVRLPRRLPRGRYVVTWRVVSADSHVRSGSYRFRVTAPAPKAQPAPDDAGAEAGAGAGAGAGADPQTGPAVGMAPPDPAAAGPDHEQSATALVAVARGFTMAGLLLLVGLVSFWLLAWRGIGPALAQPIDVQRAFVQRWQRMATLALWVTVAATLAGVVLQGAAASGLPVAGALQGDVIQGVLATSFGKAAVGRLVLLELLAVLAVVWRAVPLFITPRELRTVGAAALEPGVGNTRLLLLTLVVLPLLLTMSLVSHAASASPLALHLLADAVHLAAAGAWIGGLLVLAFAAFPSTVGLSPPERVRVLAPPVIRFSRIAAAGVALVVITGTIRGLDTVGGWTGLTQSAYGRALLVKLGVFAVLLVLGAFNHFWSVRRIRSAAARGEPTAAVRTLRYSVTVEAALAVVIVVTTAVLVSLPMAGG